MPKASIEGTQIPMNMAAVASPLKYNISEKISDRNAEINSNLSVVVNILNMLVLFFSFCVKKLITADLTQKNAFCLSRTFHDQLSKWIQIQKSCY